MSHTLDFSNTQLNKYNNTVKGYKIPITSETKINNKLICKNVKIDIDNNNKCVVFINEHQHKDFIQYINNELKNLKELLNVRSKTTTNKIIKGILGKDIKFLYTIDNNVNIDDIYGQVEDNNKGDNTKEYKFYPIINVGLNQHVFNKNSTTIKNFLNHDIKLTSNSYIGNVLFVLDHISIFENEYKNNNSNVNPYDDNGVEIDYSLILKVVCKGIKMEINDNNYVVDF